jgi:hypothetical protein
MPDFDIQTHLRELHRTVGALTRMPISWNMERERQWYELLRWLNEGSSEFSVGFINQFADDLRAVVNYLNAEITVGNRNPGALKFSNLIGDPSRFEEDLGMARVKSRPRAAVTQTVRTGNTERIVPSTGCEAKAEPARVPLSRAIEAMRAAVEEVGRDTPCAPQNLPAANGAHGVTRPT